MICWNMELGFIFSALIMVIYLLIDVIELVIGGLMIEYLLDMKF